MSEVGDWFKNLPFNTRYWFGGTIAFSLLGRFGLLSPKWLVLLWEPLFHNFNIWRPITSVLYYPITPQTGFHFLINLYFLYNYSLRLETGLFLGRPADFTFMLLFMWICTVIVALLGEIMFLMDCMVMAVLYVWCQLNKDMIVSFWFGTQFKAMYLPWVLLAFNMIIAGGGMMELVGILVGHLYFFLMFKYPQDFGGATLISTPQILYDWLPNQRAMGGFGQAPTASAAAGGGGGGAGGGGGGGGDGGGGGGGGQQGFNMWGGQGHRLG